MKVEMNSYWPVPWISSATLFYIVKGKERDRIGMKLKKRIITALLDGMEAHLGDDTMMRNGCLTLCQLKIPNDVVIITFNVYSCYDEVKVGTFYGDKSGSTELILINIY